MTSRVFPWFLLSALILSGCLADEADPQAVRSSEAEAPQASADFGSITVVATTHEIIPVEGAQVLIQDTERTAFTDSAGRATFNELEGGAYTVLVSKPGYRTQQDKGRVANVVPGEVLELTFILNEIPVVNEDSSYYRTLHMRGFIFCSFDGVIGYTSYCGRGLTVGGVTVGKDQNDNSTHPWKVENVFASTILMEAKWTPSFPLLGTVLLVRTSKDYACDLYACNPKSPLFETKGESPLRAVYLEGTKSNITKNLGIAPEQYPRSVWSEARAACATTCTMNLLLNQNYSLFTTTFYGREMNTGWTALE